ncbi:uncharacterized protein K02A2.6-like [Rhagoletis pomonella]|uniref:uncharacterized protein K02A2.6-like n=1 Tax=Rhagoletis pomonella TaxID=28610 RepID=UPI001785731D|nr:uncharacterized protein K02A2.6-like [Rhagoletis pomonella]
MSLRSLKVCELKKRYREARLPVSGNKNQLVERLLENDFSESVSDNETVVLKRTISSLEKTITELVSQQNRNVPILANFNPTMSSPPINAVETTTQLNTTVTSTYTVANPKIVPTMYNGQHSLWTTAQEPSNNNNFTEFSRPRHIAFVPQSNVHFTHASTQVPPVTSVAYTAPYHPSAPYAFDHVRAPQIVPHYYNPYENVRDIVELLPYFDPSSDRSLSSKQFVKRVENLKSIYGWRESTLLFAVQQKMRGSAKYWVDSLQDVFISWPQFVNKFLLDFPCIENEADVHIKMAQTKRQSNESAQEFYYRMLALGAKGGLSDSSIARHIINGINDFDLRKKISNDYNRCQDLLRDIINFSIYNDVKNASAKSSFKMNPPPEKNSNRKLPSEENQNPTKTVSLEKVKCYNCFQFGHYSINCKEPQRKPRCEKCQRTTHKTADCVVKVNSRVNKIEQSTCDDKINKVILVNGIETIAFVDPGSSRTLVRKTFAPEIGSPRQQVTTLQGFAGGQYVSTGIVSAVIEIDGKKIQTDMLITEDDLLYKPVLLGRDVLCRAGKRLVIEQDQCRVERIQNIVVTNELNLTERQEFDTLLTEYPDVFANNLSEIGKCGISKMTIELNTDKPIYHKPYRIPFAKRAIVFEIVSDLLKNEIIRPSDSSYAAPVVLVEKKNGEHRLCVDYRSLNKVTLKKPYPMPIMEEQFSQLSGNIYFTTLDLRTGYHQIEIDENSKKFTAFVTTDGHYEYNRMPFGLVNAPAFFQSLMDKIVAQMPPGEILAYLDDVIIPSQSIDEGHKRLEKFFKILKQNRLTLRMDKCKFLEKEIDHLGHIINENGIKPGKRKVAAIENFPPPKNVTEVRRFLGLAGFFRKFVPNFSLIAKAITRLLHKSEQNNFVWGEMQQQAFLNLIQQLCSEPLL